MVINKVFGTFSALLVGFFLLCSAQLHAAEVSVSQSSIAYRGLAERA